MTTEPSPILYNAGVRIRRVHDTLLKWVEDVILAAGIDGIDVVSRFPTDGATRPYLAIYPYRFRPEPTLVSTARPSPLMGWSVRSSPQSLPQPWGQLGALLTESISLFWPRRPNNTLLPAAPPELVPEPLRAWYRARDAWTQRHQSPPLPAQPAPEPHDSPRLLLPTMWWEPGISTAVHYIATGGAAGTGFIKERQDDGSFKTESVESTPLLMSAHAAMLAACHRYQGFTIQFPQPFDYAELASFCAAVDDALGSAPPAPQVPQLREALQQAQELFKEKIRVNVTIEHTNDVSNSELFTLMQALQEPVRASLCFRVTARLGERLLFGPSAEARASTQESPFVYDAQPRRPGRGSR